MSYQQGIFPADLKQAIIIPIHKTGDKSNSSNYRPISLLPSISKLFEINMKRRLLDYLSKFQILASSQYGFRKKHNTVDAVLDILNNIQNLTSNKQQCLGLFIDFKKAFDTVSFPIMLNKLNSIGIRGKPYEWFYSYLNSRNAATFINNVYSGCNNIRLGVPQGSILGSIMFLLYINDLQINLKKCKTILFADDTSIIINGKDSNELINNFNICVYTLENWVEANNMALNVEKTKIILFSNGIDENFIPKINNRNVEIVDNFKILGILLDNKFKFTEHYNMTYNKLIKYLAIFSNIRDKLNKKSKYLLT